MLPRYQMQTAIASSHKFNSVREKETNTRTQMCTSVIENILDSLAIFISLDMQNFYRDCTKRSMQTCRHCAHAKYIRFI